MNHDHRASLSFLRMIYENGPWLLTAIASDKSSIDAKMFEDGPSADDDILSWLDYHSKKNLYYSVNEPIHDFDDSKKKLAKSEVYRVHYLHVDVDPRADADLEQEQSRILEQLLSYRIPPSFLIFSGGGFNALWKLSRPLPVAHQSPSAQETIARATDIERRNWQFELDFATPDHCRDVSRILRLPGTINWPSREKILKGRQRALSGLKQATGRSHEYSDFEATPVQASINAGTSTMAQSVVPSVRRLESLSQLPKRVPESLKAIITQGFDPDKDAWDGDRSGVLFFVCCELVRHDVPDDIIMGIITDPRFLISQSVLDKRSSIDRYAARQISRAREHAFHPKLAEYNERNAVIANYGGKCVVMTELDDGELDFVRPREFKDANDHKKIVFMVRGKEKSIGEGSWWFSQEQRRQYDRVVFEPGMEVQNAINLWRGYGATSTRGDKHARYLDHVHENICSGDTDRYDYLIKWMARVVQFPRSQSMVAPVLLGARGTGKSVFCRFFAQIFEPHVHIANDTERLTGRFNSHLSKSILVIAEEAFDLRDKRHESVLKEIITGHTMASERKGFDVIQLKNYVHLIMTSNNERVVPAGDHERRFFVIKVSNARMQSSDFFGPLIEDMKSGGVDNLLHFLMHEVDLSRFDVTKPPKTTELMDQQIHNLGPDLNWLLSKLSRGFWTSDSKRWTPIRRAVLFEDYRKSLTDAGVRQIKGEASLMVFLRNQVAGFCERDMRTKEGEYVQAIEFASLVECRRHWDEQRGWKNAWKEIAEDSRIPATAMDATLIPSDDPTNGAF